ncbi:hypothetical protein R5W24_000542 [Gemmata sp. JC717]|uniref:hypothetical protein n=1 Tax=Gemmata algarum TaxID=2975278 RepID=UPI0021BB0AF0|nr:hypothetical protein [Gemmata algarum]MDY3551466.1 hypothetical protein [Gemmata algarum]
MTPHQKELLRKRLIEWYTLAGVWHPEDVAGIAMANLELFEAEAGRESTHRPDPVDLEAASRKINQEYGYMGDLTARKITKICAAAWKLPVKEG